MALTNEGHRIASALFSLIFISLLLLKNQINSRIATQAGYISSILRPKFEEVVRMSRNNYLTYEDFAKQVRARKLQSKISLRVFLFENAIIGLPMLATTAFSIIGAAIHLNFL